MPNPDQLWIDMEKLNALYEELCWLPDDELVFSISTNKVEIRNVTKHGREDNLPY